METLPFEVTFVDAADTVAYFNRLDREKLFPRTRSVIGRKVEKCHPEKSVSTVQANRRGVQEQDPRQGGILDRFPGRKNPYPLLSGL